MTGRQNKRNRKKILGLSNNRKWQQTKKEKRKKERLAATASLCKEQAITCKNDSYIFFTIEWEKRANIKGVFRGSNKNFIKPKSIPSNSSNFVGIKI